ncbi:DUF99 family protein [soil metagenome]
MPNVTPNVIGFDDAPFARDHRGDVRLVGIICSRTRPDGVLSDRVRRDGRNSTEVMIRMVERGPFAKHIRAVFLQGIAVAGFNVVDIHELHARLGVPVIAVVRRQPDFPAIRSALSHRPGAERKWNLIESAGPLERVAGVFVQRVGASLSEVRDLLRKTTLHGNLPEVLRLAHLVAGGVTTGVSRGRA